MIPIPISDFSVTNALGENRRVFRQRLFASETGLTAARAPVTTVLGCIAALPALPPRLQIYESRVARIAWLGLEQIAPSIEAAVRRWGAARVAVVIGSSTGGVEQSERAVAVYRRTGHLPSDYSFENGVAFDALARLVRDAFGTAGPAYVISTACSSSAKAIASGQRLIATGQADAVIAGGADSLCEITLYGFQSLGVLSAERCQPFGEGRSGINLGEGSAFVVLEREASSAYYLLGAGESSDAHHLSSPHPEGAGARLAMARALAACERAPEDVSYINAHGTGTQLNDSAETLAINSLFERRVPVSSTKAATGHLLGAAGATEAVVCLLALENSKLPANLLTTRVDPTLHLDIVTEVRAEKAHTAVSNSFAFGGSNASLVIGRVDSGVPVAASAATQPNPSSTTQVVACATWPPLLPNGEPTPDPGSPPATLLSPRIRGRASSLCRMFAEVIAGVQGSANTDLTSLPIVYGSAAGEMETTLALLECLAEGTSSPVRFQASVHNTASGLISIANRNQAFSTAVAAGVETVAMAFSEAIAWLRSQGGEIIVAVADEAAVTLLNGKTYPAIAAAFLLRQTQRSTAETSTLSISSPRRTEASLSADPNQNPCAPAITLARRVAARQGGAVPLTESAGIQWVVDLQSQ